jgi:putative ABC transport system ATP-binding protein
MSDNNVIRMSGLSKTFYTDEVETRALQGIDLAVSRGEYVVIAGPSGCGKSTLLSIMGLLDEPSVGTLAVDGRDVRGLSGAGRARLRNRAIGFVFQNFNLIGDLTVFENVALPLVYAGVERMERERRVVSALERVGVAARVRHYPAQLSGGQQQRVAVARALIGNPAVLLADEPTGNLDSRNGEAVMALLDDLHRSGATICMVTHDSRYVSPSSRVIQMFDGRVVEDSASPAEGVPA